MIPKDLPLSISPHSWGYRCMSLPLAFTQVLGIRTNVLVFVQKALLLSAPQPQSQCIQSESRAQSQLDQIQSSLTEQKRRVEASGAFLSFAFYVHF